MHVHCPSWALGLSSLWGRVAQAVTAGLPKGPGQVQERQVVQPQSSVLPARAHPATTLTVVTLPLFGLTRTGRWLPAWVFCFFSVSI